MDWMLFAIPFRWRGKLPRRFVRLQDIPVDKSDGFVNLPSLRNQRAPFGTRRMCFRLSRFMSGNEPHGRIRFCEMDHGFSRCQESIGRKGVDRLG